MHTCIENAGIITVSNTKHMTQIKRKQNKYTLCTEKLLHKGGTLQVKYFVEALCK